MHLLLICHNLSIWPLHIESNHSVLLQICCSPPEEGFSVTLTLLTKCIYAEISQKPTVNEFKLHILQSVPFHITKLAYKGQGAVWAVFILHIQYIYIYCNDISHAHIHTVCRPSRSTRCTCCSTINTALVLAEYISSHRFVINQVVWWVFCSQTTYCTSSSRITNLTVKVLLINWLGKPAMRRISTGLLGVIVEALMLDW